MLCWLDIASDTQSTLPRGSGLPTIGPFPRYLSFVSRTLISRLNYWWRIAFALGRAR